MSDVDLSKRTALLVDLDDTLYDYAPAERAAKALVLGAIARDTGREPSDVQNAWTTARDAVKRRLGERGSAHSRLLYLAELVHATGSPRHLARARAWERMYWTEFLRVAELRPFAAALLDGWRAQGKRVAIVTDLTLEIQLWKLETLGLFDRIDVLVTSEEVPLNKPAPDAIVLAMKRLGVFAEDSILIGDNPAKDGEGARLLGIPYLQAASSEHDRPGGESLESIARKLGVIS